MPHITPQGTGDSRVATLTRVGGGLRQTGVEGAAGGAAKAGQHLGEEVHLGGPTGGPLHVALDVQLGEVIVYLGRLCVRSGRGLE